MILLRTGESVLVVLYRRPSLAFKLGALVVLRYMSGLKYIQEEQSPTSLIMKRKPPNYYNAHVPVWNFKCLKEATWLRVVNLANTY